MHSQIANITGVHVEMFSQALIGAKLGKCALRTRGVPGRDAPKTKTYKTKSNLLHTKGVQAIPQHKAPRNF